MGFTPRWVFHNSVDGLHSLHVRILHLFRLNYVIFPLFPRGWSVNFRDFEAGQQPPTSKPQSVNVSRTPTTGQRGQFQREFN